MKTSTGTIPRYEFPFFAYAKLGNAQTNMKVIDRPMRQINLRGLRINVRIENWRKYYGVHLTGNVYGHPNFTDGHAVVTSELQMLDIPGGIAETQNTVYRLGKPA